MGLQVNNERMGKFLRGCDTGFLEVSMMHVAAIAVVRSCPVRRCMEQFVRKLTCAATTLYSSHSTAVFHTRSCTHGPRAAAAAGRLRAAAARYSMHLATCRSCTATLWRRAGIDACRTLMTTWTTSPGGCTQVMRFE